MGLKKTKGSNWVTVSAELQDKDGTIIDMSDYYEPIFYPGTQNIHITSTMRGMKLECEKAWTWNTALGEKVQIVIRINDK